MHLPNKNDANSAPSGNQSKTMIVGRLGSLMNNRPSQMAAISNQTTLNANVSHRTNQHIGGSVGQIRNPVILQGNGGHIGSQMRNLGGVQLGIPNPYPVMGNGSMIQTNNLHPFHGNRKSAPIQVSPMNQIHQMQNSFLNTQLQSNIVGLYPSSHPTGTNVGNIGHKVNISRSRSDIFPVNQKEINSSQAVGGDANNVHNRSMFSYAQNTVKRLQETSPEDSSKFRMNPDNDFNRDQRDCCITNCTNGVSLKTRFKLRLNDDFKHNYIANGWNKVCDFHYFSDLIKYRQLNRNTDDLIPIEEDEDDIDIHRYLEEEDTQLEEDAQLLYNKFLKRKRNSNNDEEKKSKIPRNSRHKSPPRSFKLKRLELGRINTNLIRKRPYIFETVNISPDPDDIHERMYLRSENYEDDSEYSELNTTTSTQNLDDSSFEGSQDIFLYQFGTPITPSDGAAYEEIVKSGGKVSALKHLNSDKTTGFTPKTPGDSTSSTPLGISSILSPSSVNINLKLGSIPSLQDEETRSLTPEFIPSKSIDINDDFIISEVSEVATPWKHEDLDIKFHSTVKRNELSENYKESAKKRNIKKKNQEIFDAIQDDSSHDANSPSDSWKDKISGEEHDMKIEQRKNLGSKGKIVNSSQDTNGLTTKKKHPKSPIKPKKPSKTQTIQSKKQNTNSDIYEDSYPFDEELDENSDDSEGSFYVTDESHVVDIVGVII